MAGKHIEILKRLEAEEIPYTLYYDPRGFETVQKVVEYLGVDPDMVLKTMLIKSRDGIYAFLIRGGKELDMEVVRGELQDEEARLATPDEMRSMVGMGPGEVSPLHPNIEGRRAYLDLDSTRYDHVIVGGGTPKHVFKISLDDLVRLLKPFYTSI